MLFGKISLEGITMTEEDRLSLAYNIALRDSNQYQPVRDYIFQTMANGDLLARFKYVFPAVSCCKQIRDSVFNALMKKENRTNEVWAAEALGWLNHPWRRMESEEYISQVLEKLKEIQETGDIFFPSDWLRAALSGHTSKYVYSVINQFLEKHPAYSQNLRLKILSASDHLRRLHTDEGD